MENPRVARQKQILVKLEQRYADAPSTDRRAAKALLVRQSRLRRVLDGRC